jgi:flavin reductase (DIM6/NTAB) family NADH-FMN oxidoreductase RutF
MLHSTTPLDPRAYRNTIGLFATGVTIVSTQLGETVHGMTANAVTSLSLEPMLLLVAVGKKARLATLLPQATGFTVNILRADQEALSGIVSKPVQKLVGRLTLFQGISQVLSHRKTT